MIERTRGVVFHTVAYSDKASFVHVYTERFGRVAFLLPQSQGRKSRMLRPLFRPFSYLEIDCEKASNQDIFRLREVRQIELWQHLYYDPVKNAVALFLTEVLSHLFREPDANPSFFDFLVQSIALFDIIEDGKANFHLWFLLRLSGFLGFEPNVDTYKEGLFFDMVEGSFVSSLPSHSHFLQPHEAVAFAMLMRMTPQTLHRFRFSRGERKQIIEHIMTYYRVHNAGYPEIRSLEILHTLFD